MKFDKKLYGGDFEYYALSKPKLKFEDFFKLKNNHMFFSSEAMLYHLYLEMKN